MFPSQAKKLFSGSSLLTETPCMAGGNESHLTRKVTNVPEHHSCPVMPLCNKRDPSESPYAISANINWGDLRVAKAIVEEDLEMAMTMKMESLSWILLLQMHASSNESQRYLEESLSELGLSSEIIHQAQGQFNRRIN